MAVLPALSAPLFSLSAPAQTATPDGVLLSWNDGPAKQAILDFVRATTDPASPKLVPPEERIATFDQDGTLWVEHPVYSQLIYCFDRVPAVVKAKPALAKSSRSRPCCPVTAKRLRSCRSGVWKKLPWPHSAA